MARENLPSGSTGQPGGVVASTEDTGLEPVLRVPEDLTPLPAVDAAMPLLEHFATIVGRKRARFKIALLKTLQGDGAGRWKIRRLQEIVHWMEPGSVTDIVAELKTVEVLSYEQVTGFYRLTPSARVVTALLDAMTIPEVHPRSLVKFLNKAMALAQAGGAGEDVVLRQFQSAIAVLRGDSRIVGFFGTKPVNFPCVRKRLAHAWALSWCDRGMRRCCQNGPQWTVGQQGRNSWF